MKDHERPRHEQPNDVVGGSLPELREVEEIEDVEEVEEIEEIEPAESAERIYREISDRFSVQYWTRQYVRSTLPLLLLDSDLLIIWANLKFQQLYGDFKGFVGQHITQFYIRSLHGDTRASFLTNLGSSQSVYSWRGLVERKGCDDLLIKSNLLVLPVFESPEKLRDPLAYIVLLDDVTHEHRELVQGLFTSLLEASKLKDHDTGNHIQRVNAYSHHISESLMGHPSFSEIDREFLANIEFLAAMHDIGKIGTPDDILNKDGPLDDREWSIMKEHTINGAFILKAHPHRMAKEIALSHHERWDGSGYPYGLSEEMIPLSARIVAIADVYDALRMRRSYKSSFGHDEAVQVMCVEEAGHFDPSIFELFLENQSEFDAIHGRLRD